MKKLLKTLVSALLALTMIFSLSACNRDYEGEINIYMPDGAPALAFSQLMHEENKLGKEEKLTYTVVPAAQIGASVAGETAEVALIPVNAAVKLTEGKGDKYKLAAVITHGNLFILGTQEATAVIALKGKTVAVPNLANVPGLTLKAILKKNNIEYTEDITKKTSENVLLIDTGSEQTAAPAAATMVKTNIADFAVIPEPAATNLSKAQNLSVRLSLQTLWGEEGYPQAVLLVKKELTKDGKFVEALLDAIDESATWVKTHTVEAVTAISAHFVQDQATTLKAPALNETAITNCNIKVEKAKSAKAKIKDYMERINAVGSASFGTPQKDFFLD